eukprot:14452238-Alexandrium_andersonii.AAC.1
MWVVAIAPETSTFSSTWTARRPLRPGARAGGSPTWGGPRTGHSRALAARLSVMARVAVTLTSRRASAPSSRPRRPSSA